MTHSNNKPTIRPTTGPNWPLLHNHQPPTPIFVSQLPSHPSQPLSKPRSKLWEVVERGGNKGGQAEGGIGEGETPIWDRETQERKTPIWERERERAKYQSEQGAWNIWVWVWVWAKSRDKESGLVREKKKHHNQLWWWR